MTILSEAYQNDDKVLVASCLSLMLENLRTYFRRSDYDKLIELADECDSEIKFLQRNEQQEHNISYDVGYLCGIIAAIRELEAASDFKVQMMERTGTSKEILDIPYASNILSIAYSTPSFICATSLKERFVELDEDVLICLLEELVEFGLLTYVQISHYHRHYHLTSLGRKFVDRYIQIERGFNDEQ